MPTFGDGEIARTNLQRKSIKKYTLQWNGLLGKENTRDHPTQKPLALMKWCITLAGDVQTILDPFMGSGTTLRAAKDLGRKAVGCEMEERYCEISANRCRQEVLNFNE
jgi:DNA modification methylase